MHAHGLLICKGEMKTNLTHMDSDNRNPKAELYNELGKKKTLTILEQSARVCGDEWARTTDSRIFSPMLYQLSYITVESDAKVGI